MSTKVWEFGMSPRVPDWALWSLIPKVAINDLCSLALNVDPELRDSILNDLSEHPDNYWGDWLNEKEDVMSYGAAFYRLQKIVLSNLDMRGGSIESFDKYSMEDQIENSKIKITDFVGLFDGSTIHFPDEFPKYRKQNTDSLLTKNDKSRLTQENNQLKKMFNEMVKFHYPSGVSAYELAKNIRTSEPTINKYLKNADL